MPAFSHLFSSALTQELGDGDSTRLFTTGRRQDAVNRGLLEFADLTECFLRQSTIALVSGTREYNLLSTTNIPGNDYLRLSGKSLPEYVFTNDTGKITRLTGLDDFPFRSIGWLNQNDPGWRDSTGDVPSAYYERFDGGRRFFGLDRPAVFDSSETANIVLPYVARPQTMTDDTHVPFFIASTAAGASTGIRTDLEPYHQAAVHYAAYELEKLRINTEAVQTQWQLFINYIQRFMAAGRPKGGTQLRFGRSYFADARAKRWTDNDGAKAYPWPT